MKYLAQLRQEGEKKEIGQGVAPPKLTKGGFVGSVGGSPPPVENFQLPPLTRQQEVARRQVIAQLVTHPEVQRAFATRWEDDLLIVALAVRGVGTCELAISAEQAQSPKDWADLLACLDQPEGTA